VNIERGNKGNRFTKFADKMAEDFECVIVETDVLFERALAVMNELRDANRVNITHFQEAFLDRIRSNVRDENNEDRSDLFGAKPGNSGPQRRSAFSDTSSCILRYLMLNASGIPIDFWPRSQVKRSTLQLQRNHNAMQTNFYPQNEWFQLATNAVDAHGYIGKYDQQFPPMRIRHELEVVPTGNMVLISGMMLIFRFHADGNLFQVIEIKTTCQPVEDPINHWRMLRSPARVMCIVRDVLAGKDGTCLKSLKNVLPQMNDRFCLTESTEHSYKAVIPEDPKEPCDIKKLSKVFNDKLVMYQKS
jgi:hypothetical protein